MMEDQRGNARFGLHHESFRQMDPDFFGMKHVPELRLVLEVGARRISEAVALAAIARREALVHCHGWRVGKAPVLANTAMQPFGGGFRCLDTESLQRVCFEIFAALFRLFRMRDNAFASGDHKQRDVIAAAVLRVERIITQTEPVRFGLASKAEALDRRVRAWSKQMQRVPLPFYFKELPYRAG